MAMKTSASLWSANLLDVGQYMDLVEDVVYGFHIDVMDGHFVPELLFGPDFVRAVAGHTNRLVDVHLMVAAADRWIDRFADAGAEMLTVHPDACAAVAATLARIEARGVRPAVAVTLDAPLEPVWDLLERVDRILLMGTPLGIKGVEIDPGIYERIRTVVGRRDRGVRRPEVFVDGGIRRHTLPLIAAAGADGVTPGSLIFGAEDPAAAVRWIAQECRPA
jgi:ribulose-phosphate 3-epimerase